VQHRSRPAAKLGIPEAPALAASDFQKAQKSRAAKKICAETDGGHVQERGIHYGIIYAFLRPWVMDSPNVEVEKETVECLPMINSLTKKQNSSMAAGLLAYFNEKNVSSIKGFEFNIQTAFGLNTITVDDDVSPVGRASLFVSYSWQCSLPSMLHHLIRELKTSQTDGRGLFSEIQKDDNFNGRLWIDCFAINQHGGTHTKDDVGRIAETIKNTTHGTILYLRNLTPLTRIWCIYEMYHSIIYEKPIYNLIPLLNTGIYGKNGYVGLCLLLAAGLGDVLVDVSKAQATVASDRKNILEMIEESIGCDKVNNTVRAMLKKQALSTMNNFLARGNWSSKTFPKWATETRHERMKQLPGWLKQIQAHIATAENEESFTDSYETLGIAFMSGDECMQLWLKTPWERKLYVKADLRILAGKSKARKADSATKEELSATKEEPRQGNVLKVESVGALPINDSSGTVPRHDSEPVSEPPPPGSCCTAL